MAPIAENPIYGHPKETAPIQATVKQYPPTMPKRHLNIREQTVWKHFSEVKRQLIRFDIAQLPSRALDALYHLLVDLGELSKDAAQLPKGDGVAYC